MPHRKLLMKRLGSSMDNQFKADEKLYRAVYPPEVMNMYWRRDGRLSSAAFADPNGLSVDRGDYRSDDEVVQEMVKRFSGSDTTLLLSKQQRHHLSEKAVIVFSGN